MTCSIPCDSKPEDAILCLEDFFTSSCFDGAVSALFRIARSRQCVSTPGVIMGIWHFHEKEHADALVSRIKATMSGNDYAAWCEPVLKKDGWRAHFYGKNQLFDFA